MDKKKILVLCTGNSCRSQMAEGYLRHFAGDNAEVFSAGTEAHGVNPSAIATMAADGIDISGHSSKTIDAYYGMDFDFVITVCDNAKENCPYFATSAKRFHYNFPDPAKATGTEAEVAAAFAETRNAIRAYCSMFAVSHF